jgi:phosphoglycolate phosphatase-like HAD superfamily hydrolase
MVTRNKPFPEGLFMVAEKLALEPATLLMVGDHAHDAEGSRLAGTKFAGVAWSQRANISAFGSDNVGVFRTVAGLRTWLKKNVL